MSAQYSQTLRRGYALLFLAVLTSCGSESGDAPAEIGSLERETHEIKQPVVVNGFDGDSTCELRKNVFDTLNGSGSLSDNELLREYRLKMLTHSSVRITVPTIPAGEKCVADTAFEGYGNAFPAVSSGQLTSASRITTAHHAVAAHNYTSGGKSFDSIRVGFGGLDYKTTNKMPITYPNKVRHSISEAKDFSWCEPSVLGSQTTGIEDPFLANRLYTLGLYNWADFSKNEELRMRLREWDSLEVDVACGNLSNPFTYDASTSQASGRDVGYLRFEPHTFLNEMVNAEWSDMTKDRYLVSGPYDIKFPGPYFTRSKTVEFDTINGQQVDPFPSDNQSELYLMMHHEYGARSTVADSTPFISRGYRETQDFECTDVANLCLAVGPNNLPPFISPFNVDYIDCFRASLDARKGTSGAGVFGAGSVESGDGNPRSIDPWSPVLKGLAQSAAEAKNEKPDDFWANVPTSTTVTPDGSGINEFAQKSNMFTMLRENEIKWANRDEDFSSGVCEPFNPGPKQPPEDGCPGYKTDSGCVAIISYGVPTGDGYVTPADLPDVPLIPLQGQGSSHSDPTASGGVYNYYEDEARALKYEPVFCYGQKDSLITTTIDGRKWFLKFTQMQGLLGSANQAKLPRDPEEARVEALAPTCVPWSSASWLTNWSWATLRVLADTWIRADNVIKGSKDTYPFEPLWKMIQTLYEERVVEHKGRDYLTARPPSMVNCPPNYYLNGVDFYKVDKSGEPLLAGVSGLACRVHKASLEFRGDLPKDVYIGLEAGSKEKGYRSVITNQDSIEFSLDQLIGESRISRWNGKTPGGSYCPKNKVAIGFITKRNRAGNIIYFNLLCVLAPGGGTP